MKDQTNVDTTQTTKCLEWCAGYGGISLGLKRAIPSLRTIAFGEIEAFACANLVAKMEAGLLDPAPIWTDIKTFPCEAFRDRVDILVAGYPCQPFSAAGKRLGAEDPRHLWPYIQRSISIIRPRLCFFENVEGHISLGLSTVISDLEELGYKVSWGIFSASEVGAPHQRKRVFILAYCKSVGGERLWADWIKKSSTYVEQILPIGSCKTGGGELVNACYCSNPAHGYAEAHRLPSEHWQEICAGFSGGANATAWPSRPGEPQHGWEPPRVVGAGLAHTGSLGRRGRSDGDAGGLRGEIQTAGSCGGGPETMGNPECLRISASRKYRTMDEASGIPTDREGCESAQADPESSAARKRENHGADAAERSEAQPALGRDADGPAGGLGYAELCVSCDNRTDELRLLGNGVVPATAERAFLTLWEELTK